MLEFDGFNVAVEEKIIPSAKDGDLVALKAEKTSESSRKKAVDASACGASN
jgi:hypothetical protein